VRYIPVRYTLMCEVHACICKMYVYEVYAVMGVLYIWEIYVLRSSLPMNVYEIWEF
jgi:hypothetical protein